MDASTESSRYKLTDEAVSWCYLDVVSRVWAFSPCSRPGPGQQSETIVKPEFFTMLLRNGSSRKHVSNIVTRVHFPHRPVSYLVRRRVRTETDIAIYPEYLDRSEHATPRVNTLVKASD